MKKHNIIFIILFLTLSVFSGIHIVSANEPYMKVKLVNYLGNKNSIPISVKGTYINNNGQSELIEGKNYTIKLENNNLSLYEGVTKIKSLGTSYTFKPKQYGESNYIRINGKPYLGTMEFTIENNQYIRPINTIPLEDYLKGVVPHEMPASWNIEALKAQTIAARTYAMTKVGSTINDTISYQVYSGYNWHPNSSKAVNETKGEVLRYNNRLISAVYSSSNGGMTESNANAWGSSPLPYLPIKQDPYDPVNSWQFTLNKIQVDTTKLDLTNPDSWWLSVNESNANKTIISNIKNGIKNNGYPNTDIKIVSVNNLSISPNKNSGGRTDYASISIDFFVKDLSTNTYRMDNNGQIKRFTFNYSNVKASKVRALIGLNIFRSYLIDGVVETNESFTMKGRGYGHGVGLSQYGAKGMADQGFNYRQILNFYYPTTILDGDSNSVQFSDVVVTQKENHLIDISFSINEEANIKIDLLDKEGYKRVNILGYTYRNKGNHKVTFDANSIYTGTYNIVIEATDRVGNKSNTTKSIDIQNNLSAKKLTLSERTYLYNSPSKEYKFVNAVSPQTVTYFEEVNGWYHIRTWIGDKWINPKGAYVPYNDKVTLTHRTNIYNYPNDTKAVSSLSKQTVTIVGQSIEKDNWYLIKTWLGNKWINIDIPIKKINEQITLNHRVYLYDKPNGKVISSLAPQTVNAVAKKGNWYQVKTWIGDLWVAPEYKVITKQLNLNHRVDIYSIPSTNSKPVNSLAPQTVNAIEEYKNWYHIKTWIGDMWVKPY